ncbi:MAG: SPOR domain-containing protein [Neptuniibacter sp.]
MQQKVKYRLVGLAVIILSAAVVFPIFFEGEGYKERHLQSAIPEGPERPEIVRISPVNKPLPDTSVPAKPQTPVELPISDESVKKSIANTVAKNKIELDIHKDQPVLDQQGVPVAWTLQLASFKSEDNAKGLRKQLIENGYKVFTRKQGDLVKVYVGPEFQKTRLEALQIKLKQDFGLKGIIVRFTTQ